MTLKKLSEDHYVIVDDYGVDIYSTQKVDNTALKPLSLSEVKKLLGMVDVESRALKPAIKYIKIYTDANTFDFRKGYEKGYNEAIEDNKEKVFNKNDMIRLAIHCWNIASRPVHGATYNVNEIVEDFMKPLLPKTEWEVEFVNGELKLKS